MEKGRLAVVCLSLMLWIPLSRAAASISRHHRVMDCTTGKRDTLPLNQPPVGSKTLPFNSPDHQDASPYNPSNPANPLYPNNQNNPAYPDKPSAPLYPNNQSSPTLPGTFKGQSGFPVSIPGITPATPLSPVKP